MDFEGGKGAALVLDALVSAHPIRADIKNAEEAGESFDAITYEKGGAVLRMIEGFLGEDRFRDGIRLYMRRHREANATADDLWGALGEASGQPIVELANGWIRQIGYPLVSLSLERGAGGQRRHARAAAVLRRSRGRRARIGDALARPHGAALPRRGRRQGAAGAAHRTAARVPLAAEGAVAWCLGNAEARGFFRTAYERGGAGAPAARHRRAPPRRAHGAGLGLSGRWCARATSTIGGFLDLVASLGAETDHVVLDELVGRLSMIEHRHVAEADRGRFDAFVADLFGAQAATLGWGARRRAPPRTTRPACAARRCCARSCCWRARRRAIDEAARRDSPRGGRSIRTCSTSW